MWEETKLEKFACAKIATSIGQEEAKTVWANYVSARSTVINYILPGIDGAEPQLSDHGPRHIKDVMENAWGFVGDQTKCPIEIFILCVSILYHDVGNFFGRKDHHQRITKIFNETYPDNCVHKKKIRTLVMNIAGAHTGDAPDKSKDTLKFLVDDNLFKTDLRTQELATVLRLSDELAEGPQRTSSFRIKNGLYDRESSKFHIYADCCSPPHIRRKSGQIALLYHITLRALNDGTLVSLDGDIAIEILLEFIFGRIVKLDQERKYCAHYSNTYLTEFRETSVAFEFWHENDALLDFSTSPLVLNDLVVPGSHAKSIAEHYPEYAVDLLVRQLKEKIGG